MDTVARVLVGVVAALHVYFLVLEVFLWQTPKARALTGLDAATATATARIGANQGLYNGILAAGLVWGLIASDPTGFAARVFFLSCIVVAGVYGGLTINRRILLAQAVPAAAALVLTLLAG